MRTFSCLFHYYFNIEWSHSTAAVSFWLTLKISSGHFSPSLLIAAKSIYWHYKTEVGQYNSALCMRKLSVAQLLVICLDKSRVCVTVTLDISTVVLDAPRCKSWLQFYVLMGSVRVSVLNYQSDLYTETLTLIHWVSALYENITWA